MIDLSKISNLCNILKFAFGIVKYIWANKKKISRLLQQMADKFCEIIF